MGEARAARPERWPLVGRAEEVARIARARSDGSAGIVLAGAAGVGKTRLAREALHSAADAGHRTIWLTATEATAGLPFSAVAELIPPVTRPQDAVELFHAVADFLSAQPGKRPVFLGVDDAHLLDDGSAGLVLHLANRRAAFVVATVGIGEPCPDAVRGLWKQHLAQRIDLQTLSDDEVQDLLERVLGGPVQRDTALRLADVTGGNPLFIAELVAAAEAKASLQQVHGLWRWDGAVDFPSLREAVRTRLDGLPAAQRLVVELVALGEPLPLDVLTRAVPEEDVLATEARGLLAMDAVGAARLAHPLYGEVLRGMVGPALRRAHSRRLSEALIATESSSTGHELPFPGAGNELRLAAWSLEAGLPVQVEVLVAASRAAQAVFEHPGAVRLARAAVEAGGGVPASLALAAALRGNSEPDAAEQVLDGIEDTIRDDPRRLAYLRLRTDNLVGDLGHPQDALAVLERSRGWAADRSWQDVVEALSLAALLNEGRYQEIADRGTRLLARDDLVAATRFTALTPFALALVELGRPADALTVADERVQLAAELAEQFPRHLRDTMQIRLSAMDSLGRWGEMEAYGRAYYEHAVRQHDQETLGRAAFLLGSVAAARGQLDTARRWLAEAVGHLEIRDGLGLQVGCAARLAKILAVSGHPAEAGRMLEHARTMKAARGREQDRYLDLPVAEVWVRAAGGDLAGARAAARHYARSFAGRPGVQALLLHDAYRLGDHSNDLVDELREATAGTDSPLHAAFTAHASARTGGELDRASRRFAELGANLLAAEAAAAAAAAHAAAHDQQSSRRAASTAARLLGQCAGARTPALISLAAPTLTARERQVALLAADGLSNAAIAARLQLSERTVESHLYRAGDKLGITRRAEFATALH